ncbi:hypothetical protein BS50DRAFT_647268 [Corynespora cassiicola Philippines]|uniref:F-box domain-containing protein n=1 Tax=Corynespora cassiicola Philippines TaxID=1448308 RepID=A0A2T2NDW7_CORCC|nr:hypothetical protein BS50DRAFT_647268 [Corynespora cassiicola Philippines]
MDRTSLPLDIEVMILKHLASGNNIAQYATVCREWQTAIEKLNFHSLSLTAQNVPTLNNIMIKRNLSLIKYVWYSSELDFYDCSDCDRSQLGYESRDTAAAIKDGIRKMLQTLSKRSHRGYMTLDLSIYPPSDAEHYFKYIRFQSANAVSRNRMKGQASQYVRVHHTLPSLRAVSRIFGLFILADFDASGHETSETGEEFRASVPQTRRQWDPITISQLSAHFPNLEDLVIEPWSTGVYENQKDTDKRWTNLVFPSLITNKLKKMTIFEDSSQAYEPRN